MAKQRGNRYVKLDSGLFVPYWSSPKTPTANRGVNVIQFGSSGEVLFTGENIVSFCNAGVCCLPDGTCDDQYDEDQCTAMGGQWNTTTISCDPNPCTGPCCIPLDPTCHTTLKDECDSNNGTWGPPGEPCTTDKCNPILPCCFPDNTCETIHLIDCLNRGGTAYGSGSCTDVDFCTHPEFCCKTMYAYLGPCGAPNQTCEPICEGVLINNVAVRLWLSRIGNIGSNWYHHCHWVWSDPTIGYPGGGTPPVFVPCSIEGEFGHLWIHYDETPTGNSISARRNVWTSPNYECFLHGTLSYYLDLYNETLDCEAEYELPWVSGEIWCDEVWSDEDSQFHHINCDDCHGPLRISGLS